MPPMQLLYPTAHPGSDRRPPRTGLARARFHNPSNKEVIITQDCTVAPAHFQGTPYREPIPEDVSVLAHSTLLPQVGDQPGPFRQGQQVLSLLDQQGLRMMPCRAMYPPTGYTVAPLQGLPVQVCRVGEANTGPLIAPGVPDPALNLLRRAYLTPLSTLPLVWAWKGKHSRNSKATRKESPASVGSIPAGWTHPDPPPPWRCRTDIGGGGLGAYLA